MARWGLEVLSGFLALVAKEENKARVRKKVREKEETIDKYESVRPSCWPQCHANNCRWLDSFRSARKGSRKICRRASGKIPLGCTEREGDAEVELSGDRASAGDTVRDVMM